MARSTLTVSIPRWRLRVVAAIVWVVRLLAWCRVIRVTEHDVARMCEPLGAFLVRGASIRRRKRGR